jgi:hypothetical protein
VVRPNKVLTTQELAVLDQRYPDRVWTDMEDGSANATLTMPPLGDLIKTLSEWLAKVSSRLSLGESKSGMDHANRTLHPLAGGPQER